MRISDWSSDVCSSDLDWDSCPLRSEEMRHGSRLFLRDVVWDVIVFARSTSATVNRLKKLWTESRSSFRRLPPSAKPVLQLPGRRQNWDWALPTRAARSEERSVGKEGGSTCRSGWAL